ncbi:MAG: hypothetical protein EBS53_12845, partial [Bacteroidetes bacterium]|nr:hypothetical protein [Bacteroidota bacterium]
MRGVGLSHGRPFISKSVITPPSSATIKSVSKSVGGDQSPFQGLPLLKDTPVSERQELFKRKLEACSTLHDFNNSQGQLKEKEMKRGTLLEILE